jgi:hypothetical protein
MSSLRRSAVPVWALALAFVALIGFAGSRDVFWMGDFYLEVYPAYLALILHHGDLFFGLLPSYSGFATVVGAPAALLTRVLGGHETMVFRLTAIPGLLGLAWLGVTIATPVRAAGRTWWPVFGVLGAGGAIAYSCITYGHPEDPLAGALAIGAVLAARTERPTLAGVMLAAAVLAKQWAIIAILPAAFAAPRGGLRIAVIGFAGTLLVLAGEAQIAPATAHGGVSTSSRLFHPHQIWWPFGVPATRDFIAAGHGTRMSPEWLQPLVRPLIVGAGAGVALLWRGRAGAERRLDDALGVLALAFLLRCMLDPWDLVYYHLPMVLALTAWEARSGRDLPVLAVIANAAAWLTFVIYDAHTGDGPFFAYLAWTIPLAGYLAARLLRRPRADELPAGALAAA